MYHLKLHCYNGTTVPILENLDAAEARTEAADYLHRARSKRGLSVTTLEPGEEWELQWPEQGTSDYEGILRIHHQTFECRECGFEHETKDDAAGCCDPSAEHNQVTEYI